MDNEFKKVRLEDICIVTPVDQEHTVAIDKSIRIFLISLFGLGGVFLILMSWINPLAIHERLLLHAGAILGIVFACFTNKLRIG